MYESPCQQGLSEALSRLSSRHSGDLGVAARNLQTGEAVTFCADDVFPTASVIKLPILVELLRRAHDGLVSLDARIALRDADKRPGSGILWALDSGLQPTLQDLATLMTIVSDNTATNLVIDAVGGVEAVNESMDRLGFHSIRLHNPIDFERYPDVRQFGESTPRQMCDLVHGIAIRNVFGTDVSGAVEHVLAQQQYFNQVPRYIRVSPYTVGFGHVTRVTIANKTGFSAGTRADAGIVRFPGGGFSYAVFNHDSKDEGFLPEAEGDVLAGLVGKTLLERWWPAELGDLPVVSTAHEEA